MWEIPCPRRGYHRAMHACWLDSTRWMPRRQTRTVTSEAAKDSKHRADLLTSNPTIKMRISVEAHRVYTVSPPTRRVASYRISSEPTPLAEHLVEERRETQTHGC